MHDARVLASRHMGLIVDATREDEGAAIALPVGARPPANALARAQEGERPFLGTVHLEALPYRNVDLKQFYPYGDPKFP